MIEGLKSETINGTTDASANVLVYNGSHRIIGVNIPSCIGEPFIYNGDTYIKVYDTNGNQKPNFAVTGTYYRLTSLIPWMFNARNILVISG